MKLDNLQSSRGARRRRTRVGHGRSSGKGKTCGRGQKGQMSRKGHKHKPGFEGGQMPLIRRLPKRGFHSPTGTKYSPVNVGALSRFDEGSEVTAKSLREAGLAGGSGDGVKILGSGELKKKLTVKAHAFSASAKSKIEAAGGACEVISN
ncbi:MAG: 50S ribosomal protein L15 [Kiritimatiellia bacterium]